MKAAANTREPSMTVAEARRALRAPIHVRSGWLVGPRKALVGQILSLAGGPLSRDALDRMRGAVAALDGDDLHEPAEIVLTDVAARLATQEAEAARQAEAAAEAKAKLKAENAELLGVLPGTVEAERLLSLDRSLKHHLQRGEWMSIRNQLERGTESRKRTASQVGAPDPTVAGVVGRLFAIRQELHVYDHASADAIGRLVRFALGEVPVLVSLGVASDELEYSLRALAPTVQRLDEERKPREREAARHA